MAGTLQHIGVIMDGNRRWAKSRSMAPHQGHNEGAKTFGSLCEWCIEEGIKYLTVYAFSTENWKREPFEVNHIFSLMKSFFNDKKAECIEKGIKILIIGDRTKLNSSSNAVIDDITAATKDNSKLIVQIALNYGGRDEITRAVKKMAVDLLASAISPRDITPALFNTYLDTSGIPDVDLVIKTGAASGFRLSNFLPWQTIYSELYFTKTLWPDFSRAELLEAISIYHAAQKNYGR